MANRSTAEQERYLAAVERNLAGVEGVSPGHAYTCGDWPEEGSFSRSSCDSCGSTFGGNRFAAHGCVKAGTYPHSPAAVAGGSPPTYTVAEDYLLHLDICVDCLCYHANGDLPPEWEAYPGEREDLAEEEEVQE